MNVHIIIWRIADGSLQPYLLHETRGCGRNENGFPLRCAPLFSLEVPRAAAVVAARHPLLDGHEAASQASRIGGLSLLPLIIIMCGVRSSLRAGTREGTDLAT